MRQGTRDCDGKDAARAALTKRSRSRGEGGSRGGHIIKQKNALAPYGCTRAKCILNILFALHGSQPHLRASLSRTHEGSRGIF